MRRRSVRVVHLVRLALAVAVLLALVVPVASASPAMADAVVPVDLIMLQPGVLDLEATGLDGFAPYGVQDAATAADYVADEFTDAAADVTAAFDEAGFVRFFRTRWTDGEAAADLAAGQEGDLRTAIGVYASQFQTAAGAADGFLLAESGDLDVPVADLDFGDRSEVSDVAFTEATTGVDYTGVDATVQLGPLVVGVQIVTRAGSPEAGRESDLAIELLGRYADRIAARAELPTGTLALEAVRFQSPSLHTPTSGYPVLDGAAHWVEPWATVAERDAAMRADVAAGVVSRYELQQRLDTVALADATNTGYFIGSRHWEYETGDQARAAFDDVLPYWEADGWEIEQLDGAPEMGDESVAIAAVGPSHTGFYHALVVWRDGADVHEQYIQQPDRFADPRALFALVEAQAACTAAGDCWRDRGLPEAVLDDAGPLVGEGAQATPVPSDDHGDDQDATPAPVDDVASYESDDHGFTVSWDTTTWARFDDYEPALGDEGLELDRGEDGILAIEVIDGPPGLAAGGCVDFVAGVFLMSDGIDALEPLLDEDGDEIAGDDAGFAFAAWTFRFEGQDVVQYIGCAALDDDHAVAFIYLGYLGDDVDDAAVQLADVQAVIDSYDQGR